MTDLNRRAVLVGGAAALAAVPAALAVAEGLPMHMAKEQTVEEFLVYWRKIEGSLRHVEC